jgi:hypothetical protein
MEAEHMTMRKLLLVDAGTCLAMGLLLLAGAGAIAELTNIPSGLLHVAGLVLMPIAVYMATVALWALQSPLAAWSVIGGNVLWVIASVALMAGPWIEPNVLGHAFIGVQAVAVALLAVLEFIAHRARADAGSPARGTGIPSAY